MSAVLHCAEDIEEAIADKTKVDIAAIEEAIEVLNLCISHQRNIVNDVLAFSKIDASMLSLTPRSCQPSRQLADTLKMLSPELKDQNVAFAYRIDLSYSKHGISWVMADLARIGQVLINLVSNAIKFTARSEGEKEVTVTVGVSQERPSSFPPNVVFFNPVSHCEQSRVWTSRADSYTHRSRTMQHLAWMPQTPLTGALARSFSSCLP